MAAMLEQLVLAHQIATRCKDDSRDYWCEFFLVSKLSHLQLDLELLNGYVTGLLQRASNEQPEAWAAYYVAITAISKCQTADGLGWMQKSLNCALEEDLPYLMNRAATALGDWCSLGGICSSLSNPQEAVEYYTIAKDAASRMDTDAARWRALWRLGHGLCNAAEFQPASEIEKELRDMANNASDSGEEKALALAYAESLSGSIAGMIGDDGACEKHNKAVLRLLEGLPMDMEENYNHFRTEVESGELKEGNPSLWSVKDTKTMFDQAKYQLAFGKKFEELFMNCTTEEAEANAAEFLISQEVQTCPAKRAMALVFLANLAGKHHNQHSFQIVESLLDEAERLAQVFPCILLRVFNEQGRNYAAYTEVDINLGKAILKFKKAARKQMDIEFGQFSIGRIDFLNDNKRSFRMLQTLLMNGGYFREALVWAERERCRDLLYILRNSVRRDVHQGEVVEFDCCEELAWEEITEVARLSGSDTALLITSHIFGEQIHTHFLHWNSHESTLLHEARGFQLANNVLDMVKVTLTTLHGYQPRNLQFWYKTLIEPFERELEQVKPKRLVIITHEALSMVPFAALYKAENEPFLIKHYAISVSPCLRMYKQCILRQQQQEYHDGIATLVIGNPTLDLQHAEEEAVYIKDELANYFDNSVTHLQKSEATKTAVLKLLPNSNWVHIAGHAVFNDTYPNGALSLACDALAAKEIEAEVVAMKATAVVLSACETGLRTIKSEGVLGLARTFHLLGVPSVVATLWKVGDGPTRVFMQKFYKHLRNSDIGLATQRAMVEMMEAEDDYGQNLYGPKEWAPFMLCGSDRSCFK